MTCPEDIIFHDTNVGDDYAPRMKTRVTCNGNIDNDCGFDVPFLDDEGLEHTPHDWWVTSSDFRRYEALHQAYTQDASWLEREDLKESLQQMRAGEGTVRVPKDNL